MLADTTQRPRPWRVSADARREMGKGRATAETGPGEFREETPKEGTLPVRLGNRTGSLVAGGGFEPPTFGL